MKAGRASRTAQHNALFRALEASLPDDRRLVEDPLAERFLSGALSVVGRLAHLPGLRAFFPEPVPLLSIAARWLTSARAYAPGLRRSSKRR